MAQLEAEAIGDRIAQARRVRGLTQEQLAEIASFSKRSLQDYETGVTIPYRHLRELGKLLNRPVEWFLNGDTEEQAVTPPAAAAGDLTERAVATLEQLEQLGREIAGLLAEQQAVVAQLSGVAGALESVAANLASAEARLADPGEQTGRP